MIDLKGMSPCLGLFFYYILGLVISGEFFMLMVPMNTNNSKQIYLTDRWDPNWDYHSGSELTKE